MEREKGWLKKVLEEAGPHCKLNSWPTKAIKVLDRARALVKYRGNDEDRLAQLRMDLANALADYDSMPNRTEHMKY